MRGLENLNLLLYEVSFGTNLLVNHLEHQRTLPFPHPVTKPMDKGTLDVRQIELVLQSVPGLRVHGTLDLCEISSWHNAGLLVIDTDLEPGLIIVARMELICNGLKELNSMKEIS
jgi:hypothetical protein